MAPLTSDPRELLVVLNPPRRKALYTLIGEITAYMQAQLKLPDSRTPSNSSPSSRQGDAPLFHPGQTSQPSPPSSPHQRSIDPSLQPSLELIRLRRAALSHFQTWRHDILSKLEGVLKAPDDAKILDARRQRAERLAQTPISGESLIDLGVPAPTDDAAERQKRKAAVAALQATYHPIPTRLTSIPLQDRQAVLSAVLLILLSTGNYSADSRALAVYLSSALELPLDDLVREETEIAVSLVESSKQTVPADMSADAEAQKRKGQNQSSRFWKVGLASVAGAAVIGVTGGLAAPLVAGAIGGLMGTVGMGGLASFLGIFWMNGALVGTLFGAFGARMTGEIVDQYAREVEDFRFIPLKDEWGRDSRRDDGDVRRLKVVIGVNGWLTSKEDVTKPWRSLGHESEVFALRYEMDRLLALGQSLQGVVGSYAWSMVKIEILKRTVLATLWSALWPAYMLSMATQLDNPFNLAKNRSEKAGRILADALINKVQGERPVTLIGYSLGARVIYSCLRTLAERRAFGLVENVVFIGAPIPSNRSHWQMMRSVVSGKMFNVYSENDYILAFLYRATSIQLGVAGLQEIKDIEGVINLNLTQEVQGHLRYPDLIGNILVRCGFPDIRGADGTIKKEEDVISLQDVDHGRTGTLIQLDDLHFPENRRPLQVKEDTQKKSPITTPSTSSAVPRSPEERRMRTTVTRKPSEALPSDFDPLATPDEDESQTMKSRLGTEPPDALKFVFESSSTKFNGSARNLALGKNSGTRREPSPPPYATVVSETSRRDQSHSPRHGTPDSDGEDSYIGIRMVDTEENDLAYVEPSPLED